jgi:NAD(P) transhydrogenase subunit alpha
MCTAYLPRRSVLDYTRPLTGSRLIEPHPFQETLSMATLDLWSMAFVFLLATFVGFQVIQNVSRLLHTPLMSLTNAISAIAVVGSLIIAGEQKTVLSTVLGAVAVAASVTNIVSGFLITDRMLKMFRERGPRS